MNRTKSLSILLVEDNPGDARLTIEALAQDGATPKIRVAEDGQAALDILAEAQARGEPPDLILLDMNLPGLTGREVLRRVKDSVDLRGIPIVVLSSSDFEDDVRSAYDLHANCYVVKPVFLDDYIRIVKAIGSFWGSSARLVEAGVT